MIGLLGLIPGGWRVGLVAVLVALAASAALYERHVLIVEGEQKAIEQQEKANAEEAKRAAAGAKNVDDCYSAGGTWDRDSGVCTPATGK
jgi:hypothetical protein